MWTLKTMAKIQAENLKSRKEIRLLQRWKTVQQILIGLLIAVITALLSSVP